MNYTFNFSSEPQDLGPFILYRDRVRPVLERSRHILEVMYDPKVGRPEVDPVLLMGICLFQMLERLPDRLAIRACLFDVRWRLALDIPADWKGIHHTNLSNFRGRLSRHGQAGLILDTCLDAMRESGYLKQRKAVRIDSTHMLGLVAEMSRLDCVRETLRLALNFLCEFGEEASWEPWRERYAERHPEELRDASAQRLRVTMEQAGGDCLALLARAEALGGVVHSAAPIRLLRRVFDENFEVVDGASIKRRCSKAGAVQNPHDPDAAWSTKNSLGAAGWVGYKIQVCETAAEETCAKGEPTPAVITAVLAQTATTSDHGSIEPVLDQHVKAGGQRPETVHADAGYISAVQLAEAERRGLEVCGPMPAPPHGAERFGSDAFDVNLPCRQAVCPAGVASATCSFIQEKYSARDLYYFEWTKEACAACPLRSQCLSAKTKQDFRSLQVSGHHMHAQTRRRLAKTPEYKKRMRRRNGIEGTISELKRGYGLRKARYRGKERVSLQTCLSAAACNLRRWDARIRWSNGKKT